MLNKKLTIHMSLFIFVTGISLNAFSQAVDKSDIGFAEKNSFGYYKMYSMIEKSLKKSASAGATNMSEEALQKTQQTLMDFSNTCGDSDSLDSVSWKVMQGTTMQDPSGAVRSIQNPIGISFSCAAMGLEDSGAVFNFVVERKAGEEEAVVSFSKQELELKHVDEKNSNSNMKLVVKESIAMAAGVAATFVVISKAFPGENDKVLHGVGSSLFASSLTAFLYNQMGLGKNTSAIVSVLITTALGYAVEEVEPMVKFQGRRGDKDMRDLRADFKGAVTGALVMRLSFEF